MFLPLVQAGPHPEVPNYLLEASFEVLVDDVLLLLHGTGNGAHFVQALPVQHPVFFGQFLGHLLHGVHLHLEHDGEYQQPGEAGEYQRCKSNRISALLKKLKHQKSKVQQNISTAIYPEYQRC